MPRKPSRRIAERRRMARADAELSMMVEGAAEVGESTRLATESRNISASGVYCISSHFLPPLSKVSLTIVLPRFGRRRTTNELIKCEGIVVRCQPHAGARAERRWELACMFSDLDDRRRNLLDDFVAWRNLEALRAAASQSNGRASARTTTRTRKSTTRTGRPAAGRGAGTTRSVVRRRTVH